MINDRITPVIIIGITKNKSFVGSVLIHKNSAIRIHIVSGSALCGYMSMFDSIPLYSFIPIIMKNMEAINRSTNPNVLLILTDSVANNKNNYGTIRMHRIILGLTNPKEQVDHIKHVNYDNRKSEMRVVNNSQNGMNKDKPKNNTSGYIGVSFDIKTDKWEAFIGIDDKKI